MFRQAVLRAFMAIPLLFLVGTGSFFLGTLAKSNPGEIIAGATASQHDIDAINHQLGVDRPAWDRYVDWLGGVFHGDLGQSFYTKADVTRSMLDAIPVSLSLTVGGLLIALVIGVPAGIWSALRAGKGSDKAVSLFATIGQAIPNFWLGLLLIMWLSLQWDVFPAVGYVPLSESFSGWLHSLALPCVALGLAAAASVSRQTRSSLIGVLQQEYVRTALSKGLSKRRVVVKHALKNAASPVVTVVAFQVAHLLGGAIVIERLFNMPGVGALALQAVTRYDPYMIQGVVLFTVIVVVLTYLLLDIAYAWLNPKVRAL